MPNKLKSSSQKSKIKLKASSSRSSGSHTNKEDLYEEEEGNSMKLSHAFFVVLILHIILIGGIFGFNYIKARQIPALTFPNKTNTPAAPVPATNRIASEKNDLYPAEKEFNSSPITDYSVIPHTGSTAQNEKSPPLPITPAKIVHSTKFRSHRVAEGETLKRIAIAYGVTVAQIESENSAIKEPLAPGQLLRIPPRGGVPIETATADPQGGSGETSSSTKISKSLVTAAQTAPQAIHSASPHHEATTHPQRKADKIPSTQKTIEGAKGTTQKEGKIYIVAAGDNPYSIARRFKINYVDLLSLNQIKDPTKLQIGSKLKIPVKN